MGRMVQRRDAEAAELAQRIYSGQELASSGVNSIDKPAHDFAGAFTKQDG